MSVIFQTRDPKQLLEAFDAAILKRELKGKITTWVKHSDMIHYTHTAAQWRYQAFLAPKVGEMELTFNIIRNKTSPVSTATYSFYHGHLIETFLNHFDQLFESANATAMPASGDRCG